ncbi:MAG: hypothetical protein ACI377_03090 [Bacteroides fragilis]
MKMKYLPGENHIYAKLSNKDAEAIRESYAAGNISQRALAKKYNVCQRTITKIVRGESYVTAE